MGHETANKFTHLSVCSIDSLAPPPSLNAFTLFNVCICSKGRIRTRPQCMFGTVPCQLQLTFSSWQKKEGLSNGIDIVSCVERLYMPDTVDWKILTVKNF